jgi:hypothetical protein
VFVAVSSRMVPAVSRKGMPWSIIDRLAGPLEGRVRQLLGWLQPITARMAT